MTNKKLITLLQEFPPDNPAVLQVYEKSIGYIYEEVLDVINIEDGERTLISN